MKHKIYPAIVVILFGATTLNSSNLFTHVRNQEFVGARPMAMGESFVAVADDINAIYWNPAGLTSLNHLGLNSMHTNLFNSSIGFNYLALSIPGIPRSNIGIDWMNIHSSDNELDFSKNKFNFSGGYLLFDWLSLGFNIKYLRFNASLDNISYGTYSGWGADWGMLCKISPKLKIGLMVHDITNTSVEGIYGSNYRQNIRVGAAYLPLKNLLLVSDIDDRLHLGTEWRLFNNLLALRTGLQQDFFTEESVTLSYGFGLNIPVLGQSIRFDYAYTDTPTLPNTHRTSLSFLIDLFPRLIKIKKVEIDPIYASLYKYHSQHPIGKVYVDYKGDENLDCTISVNVDKFSTEKKKNIVISPKTTRENIKEVTINTVFNETILAEPDDIPLTANIKISYMSGNKLKEEEETQQFYLFKRNAIDWQQGVEQAAAFITPNDPVVQQFNRYALSEDIAKDNIVKSEAITKSMQIFKTVSQFGIRYEQDSYSPYSKTYRAFDNISYPVQLLNEKHGDCDDLVVLFASLLENRNIPTALISVPEHIFLMFNSGIHARRSFQLCCAESEYFVHENLIWIPLETTWIDSSFVRAWEKGTQLFNQHSEENRQIIYVRDAWKTYEPLAYTGMLKKAYWDYPQQQFAGDRDQFLQRDLDYLKHLEEQVEQFPDSLQLRNRLAITYAFKNQFDVAEKHFRAILKKDRSNFFTINNLGNLFFARGNLDSASHYYQQAIPYATDDVLDGINLNLGLIYFASGLDSLAIETFAAVMNDSTGYQKVGNLLGIPFVEDDLNKAQDLKAKKKVSENNIKQITAKANDKVKKKSDQKKKEKKKRDLVKAGGKNYLPAAEIENIFYWAY